MNDRGFSLLEALIALAILSMVVTTSLSIASSGALRSAEAVREFRAFLMADAILQRTGAEIALSPGTGSGRLPDGSTWQLSITQLEESDRGPTTFRVEARVAPATGAPVSLSGVTAALR